MRSNGSKQLTVILFLSTVNEEFESRISPDTELRGETLVFSSVYLAQLDCRSFLGQGFSCCRVLGGQGFAVTTPWSI